MMINSTAIISTVDFKHYDDHYVWVIMHVYAGDVHEAFLLCVGHSSSAITLFTILVSFILI